MPIAPAAVRTKSARVDHRFNRNTPAFPARMVYGLLRALPGDRLVCHRRLRIDDPSEPGWAGCISARLDASTGAPGPHDFAVRDRHAKGLAGPRAVRRVLARTVCSVVRPRAVRSAHGKTRPAIPLRARRCRVHRIPPRVRDVSRSAPHPGGTGRACNGDLPDVLSGIFLLTGLDRFLLILPVGPFSVVVCEAREVPCRLAMLPSVLAISASCTNRTKPHWSDDVR